MTMGHQHLVSLYELYQSETQPFRKVHRMVDLFESIIKTYTAVMMAEYFRRNKVSDPIKGLLANGLRAPSLGTWQYFSREHFKELKSDSHVFTHPQFAPSFEKLDKDLNSPKTNVISLRNGYAHGATPSDEDCKKDIDRFSSFLEGLVTERWMEESTVTVRDGKVFLDFGVSSLCLHPILVERIEPRRPSLAFFNDSKDDRIGLLNYPLSKHYRDKDFYREFQDFIPFQEWRRMGTPDFLQRIEELTDAFKGRLTERREMLHFVRGSDRGFLSIQGSPGIGKSALVAQFCKDLSAENMNGLSMVPYFIRRGTPQAQAEQMLGHLIKRTDDLFPEGRGVHAEGRTHWELQNQLFSKWRLWGGLSKGRKLLFLIDGLDEGVEGGILSHLPRESFEGILFIYGSRPDGHPRVRDLWTELPTAEHRSILLTGLGKEDIRALIYEVSDKYAIGRESSWIDRVAERSEGNPLYLKLLCNAIVNGSIGLNDMDALPSEIHAYYEAILNRYAGDRDDGRELLRGLYVFAVAKDYMTFSQLGAVNGLDEAALHRIASTLREVLQENPLTEQVLDYQLFHESFREYVIKNKPREVEEAGERIIEYCSNWAQLDGSWDQRYALEHYAEHLSDSKRKDSVVELMSLVRNKEYQDEQKRVLRDFVASNRLFRLSLLKSSELKRQDYMQEAALGLVELRYEEANDAPRVVEMTARGEIDYALRRIETFGENDKRGFSRSFILYMLCLMELTLLSGRDKPFRREAIEKLLKHFDEQMPTDHSLLKWNDFFPSLLIFKMACECAGLGLDFSIVFRRTDDWTKEWISDFGPYSNFQFDVLSACVRTIVSERAKVDSFLAISSELARQGLIQESTSVVKMAFDIAWGIRDDSEKSSALCAISCELARLGNSMEAKAVLEKALTCAFDLSEDWRRSEPLADISKALAKQGEFEKAISCAHLIVDDCRIDALCAISVELTNKGKHELASSVVKEAIESFPADEEFCVYASPSDICEVLAKQGKTNEALSFAREISVESSKCHSLRIISSELASQGNVDEAFIILQEAIECARDLSSTWDKCTALAVISTTVYMHGNLAEAESLIQEAMQEALSCTDWFNKDNAMVNIASQLEYQCKFVEALKCVYEIGEDSLKSRSLATVFNKMTGLGKTNMVFSELLDALPRLNSGLDREWKENIHLDICHELAVKGMIEDVLQFADRVEDNNSKVFILSNTACILSYNDDVSSAELLMQKALECIDGIDDSIEKSYFLKKIAFPLAYCQGKLDKSIEYINSIDDEYTKGDAFRELFASLLKHGMIENAESLFHKRELDRSVYGDDFWKNDAPIAISAEFAKRGRIAEALSFAKGVSEGHTYIRALLSISDELVRKGDNIEALSILQESLSSASGFGDDYLKCTVLQGICSVFSNQGKTEKALLVVRENIACARSLSNEYLKIIILLSASTELLNLDKFDEAESVMRETIASIREKIDDSDKSRALQAASVELTRQGDALRAIELVGEIGDMSVRNQTLHDISIEFTKMAKYEDALDSVRNLNDDYLKKSALRSIIAKLLHRRQWIFAEQAGFEITQISERHDCWKEVGNQRVEKVGWNDALKVIYDLQNPEARIFYLRGCVEGIQLKDVVPAILPDVLPSMVNDSQSIEVFLRKYSLNLLFFGNPGKDEISRLNRTLNIQWAMDIVASFPSSTGMQRLSTNMEDWIHDVNDEDDREQISLWARQVAKGRMTEQEFQENISKIIPSVK